MIKKTLMLLFLALSVFSQAGVFAAHAAYELPESLSEIWIDIRDKLAKTFELEQEGEKLPDSAWIGADKQSNNTAVRKLLDQSMDLLLSSSANKMRLESLKLQDEIPELKEEIEEYRNKKMSAPKKTKLPWVINTVADYDEKISEAEQRIKDINVQIEGINKQLIDELRLWGLELSDAEAETLFSTVVGDGILKNAIIFQNVKAVTKKLTDLAAENKDNLEIARRYYGMYVVLIDILSYTQELFIQQIDSSWLPKISEIINGAQTSIKEANAAMKNQSFTDLHKQALKANIVSNGSTIEASEKYRALLGKQRASIQSCLDGLKRDRAVAVNTFRTVQHASDLSGMIQSGLKLFESLTSMQIPKIEVFDNSSIRREFEEITRRLQN